MTNINPKFIAIVLFLIVGLIWSGGHVAWLIALGIYTLIAVIN